MSVIVKLIYTSTIVHYGLVAIVITFLGTLFFTRIQLWVRIRLFVSRLPGPKAVPVFGNVLSLLGDRERKSISIFD